MDTSKLRDEELARAVWEKINAIPSTEGEGFDSEFVEFLKEEGITEVWQQDDYVEQMLDEEENVCATAACFAGWACILVDGYMAIQLHESGSDRYYMYNRAKELLGLDDAQANRLFHMDNDLDRIGNLLEDYYDGAEFRTTDDK
jgi:hypothetical protein